MFEGLTECYFQQGIRRAKTQHITKALEVLYKTTVFQPQHWQSWNLQGLCLYRLGEFSKAKEAWQRSLEYEKEDNPAVAYLEEMQNKDFTALCTAYNEALQLTKEKNYKRAIKILEREAFHDAQIISFENLLGLCYFASGKENKALKIWTAALELDLDHPDALRYIQKSLTKQRNKSRFLQWIKDFI